jgi:hypothetical protein
MEGSAHEHSLVETASFWEFPTANKSGTKVALALNLHFCVPQSLGWQCISQISIAWRRCLLRLRALLRPDLPYMHAPHSPLLHKQVVRSNDEQSGPWRKSSDNGAGRCCALMLASKRSHANLQLLGDCRLSTELVNAQLPQAYTSSAVGMRVINARSFLACLSSLLLRKVKGQALVLPSGLSNQGDQTPYSRAFALGQGALLGTNLAILTRNSLSITNGQSRFFGHVA